MALSLTARRTFAALSLALLLGPLAACGDDTSDEPGSASSTGTTEATPDEAAPAAGDGPCEYVAAGPAAKEVSLPPSTPDPVESLVMGTDAGDITITLDATQTPCTANSFSSLANQGYFDDTKCHRLTTSGIYVLQCGDPTATGTGGPGYSYADELSGKEKYPAGTLAMANAGPNTNGSQFFIVYDETPLPPSYTVFGTIDDAGLEVVKTIAADGADDSNGPGDGAPNTEVLITSIK